MVKYLYIPVILSSILVGLIFVEMNSIVPADAPKTFSTKYEANAYVDYCTKSWMGVSLGGWAVLKGYSGSPRIYVYALAELKSSRFRTNRFNRKDITDFFKLSTGYDLHGFSASAIGSNDIVDKGVLVVLQDNDGNYYNGGRFDCK